MSSTRWAVTILAVMTGASAQANLITNGSFETPTVPAGTYQDYLGGSTAITGWTVVGVDVAVVHGTYHEHGTTFQAQDGNQWLDLSGISSNSLTNGVTQDVSTTIGQVYDLSFYVGSLQKDGGYNPPTIDVSINGGTRVPYHNPATPVFMLDWMQFTLQFTASSSTTNITFFNGFSGTYNSALDNVSLTTAVVEAVPEPASLTLFAAGALAMGFAARRRRSHLPAGN